MVYCGKPSKGCSSCRERKIRCDQREPGCGQCEKRQQPCPGYRDLVDLMFRDESSHVISKATRISARGRSKNPSAPKSTAGFSVPGSSVPPSNDPTYSDSGFKTAAGPSKGSQNSSRALTFVTHRATIRNRSPDQRRSLIETPAHSTTDTDDNSLLLPPTDEDNWLATSPGTLSYSLSPSYQERGTAYFFSRYVYIDENACHQNYDFIFDVWRPASMLPGRQVDGVMASMTAVGLAGLSSLTVCPKMMDWARRSYGAALRLTNDTLRNPSEAVKDTTMLTILILGTFEMLTGRTPQTVQAWQQHVNGAAALAKMRGLGQFRSRAGVRMFMMLTQIFLISCIQRHMPMPQPIVELRNQLGMLAPPGDPNWRMSGPIYKVIQLRHDIKHGKLSQTDVIIDELYKLDREFADIIADVPGSWKYRPMVLSEPHPAVFGGYHCHVYPALTLAATWNGIRSIRVLVHETVIGELFKCFGDRQVLSWPHEAKLQLMKSLDLLGKLRDAIVASVPQHCGVVSFNDTKPDSYGSALTVVTAEKPPLRFGPSPATSASSSLGPVAANSTPNSVTFDGPTLYDPTQAEGRSDSAERFMTLASASNTIVWPLYLLGVSSSCTPEVKEYVVRRLEAILEETDLVQARAVAQMVRNKQISIPWTHLPWDHMPQTKATTDPVLV